MIKHAPGPAHLYKGHIVTFYCGNTASCRHYVTVPVADLAARYGEDYHIGSHAARMRCGKCGTKGADARLSWGGGGMATAHLFVKAQPLG